MEEFIENAVLVYGPRKAGTTLLQNLLDGSESIMMVPDELKIKYIIKEILESNQDLEGNHEMKKFYFAKGRSSFRNNLEVIANRGEYDIKIKDQFRIGNISEKELDERFDLAKYIDGLKKIANEEEIKDLKDIYSSDILEFKKSLRESKNYKYWASKEVGGNPDLIMTHFKSTFTESKFIFIARDPKIIARSIIMKRRKNGIVLSTKNIFRECYEAERIISYYAKVKDCPDKILIFYEDLVRDTHREMKKIAKFLQIPYSNTFEQPSLFGVSVKVRTSSQDTKTVFQEKKDWQKDLTLREKLAVTIFNFSYILFRAMVGNNGFTYQKLRKIT